MHGELQVSEEGLLWGQRSMSIVYEKQGYYFSPAWYMQIQKNATLAFQGLPIQETSLMPRRKEMDITTVG